MMTIYRFDLANERATSLVTTLASVKIKHHFSKESSLMKQLLSYGPRFSALEILSAASLGSSLGAVAGRSPASPAAWPEVMSSGQHAPTALAVTIYAFQWPEQYMCALIFAYFLSGVTHTFVIISYQLITHSLPVLALLRIIFS